MAAANVKITTELKNPSEFGVHYRLVCMTGPNKGKVYYLTGKRILLGRGENADIQIIDNKISREHAEIIFIDGSYVITDLSNQNGIIINDTKIKQMKLSSNEKIVVGQSVLKYSVITVSENSEENELVEYAGNVVALDSANKKALQKNKLQIKAQATTAEYEDNLNDNRKDGQKSNSKIIIVIIIVAALGFLFMGDDDKKAKSAKSGAKHSIDDPNDEKISDSKKMSKEDPEVKRKFDSLIHSGRREYREGNYFRAMEEFRRAEFIIPGNGISSFLMSRAKQSLDEDVAKNFGKASRDLDAKKYQSAAISLCGVLQLLQRYPEDDRYKDAKEKINALEGELGMEKDEIKCFEEKPIDSKR